MLRYFLIFLGCSFLAMTTTAQNVSFKKAFEGDSLFIHAINNLHAPLTLKFTLKEDAAAFVKAPASYVMGALDSVGKMIRVPLSEIQDTSEIPLGEWMSLKGSLGDPRIKSYDKSYPYQLPFSTQKKYKIMQGWKGSFSHSSPQSLYALDFTIPIGDTIYAAREGVVAIAIENFTEHGGRDFIDKANKVIIYHEDGTAAYYVHLDKDGALVEQGQKVKKGQAIGIAGWTGFSTKPHLHFVVRTGDGLAIPIQFAGYKKKKLKKGRMYGHARFNP